MERKTLASRARKPVRVGLAAICCAALLVVGAGVVLAQEEAPLPQLKGGIQPSPTPTGTAEEAAPKIPPEQLDSLVAPIALYPDPLLAQTLVASTYPLELVQLQQWMAKNPGLDGDALAEAVAKQPWDPASSRWRRSPTWSSGSRTTSSGPPTSATPSSRSRSDVMDAVQRMRKKAQDNGALESTEQQKVETKVVEEKTVIIVESADPEVIYVPSYSPTVVYGPPVYPYPPIYYPPYPRGRRLRHLQLRGDVGRGVGRLVLRLRLGRQRHRHQRRQQLQPDNNIKGGDGATAGSGKWEHNAQHRGGTPYSDRATANKYGGTARGDSLNSRQASARQQGAGPSAGTANRAGSAGAEQPYRGCQCQQPATGGAGSKPNPPVWPPTRQAAPRVAEARRRAASSADRVGSRSVPLEQRIEVRLERRLQRLQRLERPGQQLARRLQHGLHGRGAGRRRRAGRRRTGEVT